MQDEVAELRQAIEESLPKRILTNIDVGDKVEVTFKKIGGVELDSQEEGQVKQLVFRCMNKDAVVKSV